jgi:hypothetical protein
LRRGLDAGLLGTAELAESPAGAAGGSSLPDALTIVAFPLVIGTVVFTIAATFESPEQACLVVAWVVIAMIVTRRVDAKR